jgi:hypothetical protein
VGATRSLKGHAPGVHMQKRFAVRFAPATRQALNPQLVGVEAEVNSLRVKVTAAETLEVLRVVTCTRLGVFG